MPSFPLCLLSASTRPAAFLAVLERTLISRTKQASPFTRLCVPNAKSVNRLISHSTLSLARLIFHIRLKVRRACRPWLECVRELSSRSRVYASIRRRMRDAASRVKTADPPGAVILEMKPRTLVRQRYSRKRRIQGVARVATRKQAAAAMTLRQENGTSTRRMRIN